jgi:uncharacterized protein YdeI (YjbR/CyaY-like superfamily)
LRPCADRRGVFETTLKFVADIHERLGGAEVTPRSAESWRRWLEKHHTAEPNVWVVFFKRHTDKPTLSYTQAVETALCFGWIDGVKRSIDAQRYAYRFSPRKPDSKWSALNRQRAERLQREGRMTKAGSLAVERAKRNGTWITVPPTVDLSMPPELTSKLERDAKAAAFFESLAPSYKRQFIAWINIAKRPETRRRRVEESVALLRRREKLGMR